MSLKTLPLCASTILLISVLLLAGPAAAVTVPGDYPTIQAALDDVMFGALPDGTTIDVQPGTYMEAVRYANSAKSITLRGTGGAAATVISSAGTGQPALSIQNTSGTVSVQGFTFTGGNSTAAGGVLLQSAFANVSACIVSGNFTNNDGGGIVLSQSNSIIDNCTIRDNTANGKGGGVTMSAGSQPLIVNSVIEDNRSGLAAEVGPGGGIYAIDSSPTVRSTLIRGNQSTFAGGGIFIIATPGGTAVLTVEDSEIAANTTARFVAGSNPAEGGGIHVEEKALGRITRSRIHDNTANSGGGLNAFRARYEVTDSIIESNHAQDPQGAGGYGGGIHAISQSPIASEVFVGHSVVRNNDALRIGGLLVTGDNCGFGGVCAVLNIENSLIDGNTANFQGGGVAVNSATLTVSDSQVLRNQTTSDFGGGFAITGATATISNTTIADNSATEFGGGIFIDVSAAVSVSSSNIYNNSTVTSDTGGGIFVGSIGPPTGSVQTSQIADNSDFQIREQSCPPALPAPIFSYLQNTITNEGPLEIYKSPCFPPAEVTNIAAFNALSPGVKTVGNTDADPDFLSFAATPPQAPSVLAWSSPRASTVNIINVDDPQPGPTGSLDVSPECITVYQLDSISVVVTGTGSQTPPASCSGQTDLFNEPLGGTQTREAGQTLTAEQVTVLGGADITLRAGEQVVIKDEFTVETSATLAVLLDPCLCD